LARKPYNWKGARKINWFPGLKRAAPGSIGSSIINAPGGQWVGYPGSLGPQGGGGGGNPYGGILQDYLNQQRADFAAQGAADKGSMINALRKYAISYGELPDFESLGGLPKEAAGYFKEAMDPKTRELAAKAEREGVSSHARLAEQNMLATRRIPSQLAARGLLRSGQTGSDLNQQAMDYKRSGYDMLNEMLSGITGSVSNYQNAERERQRALAEAEMQAAWQAAGDWGDSYFNELPTQVPGVAPKTRAGGGGRPRRPGPNYVWNGRRWVYKVPRRGGAGGGPQRTM